LNKREVLNLHILDVRVDVLTFLEYRGQTIVQYCKQLAVFQIGQINQKGVELKSVCFRECLAQR
jgi:hypothetical protein